MRSVSSRIPQRLTEVVSPRSRSPRRRGLDDQLPPLTILGTQNLLDPTYLGCQVRLRIDLVPVQSGLRQVMGCVRMELLQPPETDHRIDFGERRRETSQDGRYAMSATAW
jgi:hypothetical protein